MRFLTFLGLKGKPHRAEQRPLVGTALVSDVSGPLAIDHGASASGTTNPRSGGKAKRGRLHDGPDAPPAPEPTQRTHEVSRRVYHNLPPGSPRGRIPGPDQRLATRNSDGTSDGAKQPAALGDVLKRELPAAEASGGAVPSQLAPLPPLEQSAPVSQTAQLPGPLPQAAQLPGPLPQAAQLPGPLPQAAQLPGPLPQAAPTKGDGLPWIDDEEEGLGMPTLNLGSAMGREHNRSRELASSLRVDRDVADEVAFANLGRHAASLLISEAVDVENENASSSGGVKGKKSAKKRSKSKQGLSRVKDSSGSSIGQVSTVTVEKLGLDPSAEATPSAGQFADSSADTDEKKKSLLERGDTDRRGTATRKAAEMKAFLAKSTPPEFPALQIVSKDPLPSVGPFSPVSPSPSSRFSDPASLSLPSASVSCLIHGLDVESVRLLLASRSQKGDAVRQVVESAYADAIQEEARGPGGGLRRIVELLRQNERNRLAVENVAIAIAVLSENDSVACDAFGNHGALEVLLHCVSKYDDNVVVIKRLFAAIRALVGGSRRNTKLFQGHDGVSRVATIGAAPRFQEESCIAEDALRIVATVLIDGPLSTGVESLDASATASSYALVGLQERRGASRSLSDLGSSSYGKHHPFSAVVGFVLQAMHLHDKCLEVQISGMLALRTLLAQPDRRELTPHALSDVVEKVGDAFRMHAGSSGDICWLTLGLLCDVDLTRESHVRVQVDLACFFSSLRQVVAATELETGALEEAGAKLVTRALQVTSHIGWRNKEPKQDAVNTGAVDACLEVLRVFQSQPEVLESVCGLVHELLDSPETNSLVQGKSQSFVEGILRAIGEMTL